MYGVAIYRVSCSSNDKVGLGAQGPHHLNHQAKKKR